MIVEPLPPLAALLVEHDALQERLADIAQERAGLDAQMLANLAAESAVHRMAADLVQRIEQLADGTVLS